MNNLEYYFRESKKYFANWVPIAPEGDQEVLEDSLLELNGEIATMKSGATGTFSLVDCGCPRVTLGNGKVLMPDLSKIPGVYAEITQQYECEDDEVEDFKGLADEARAAAAKSRGEFTLAHDEKTQNSGDICIEFWVHFRDEKQFEIMSEYGFDTIMHLLPGLDIDGLEGDVYLGESGVQSERPAVVAVDVRDFI